MFLVILWGQNDRVVSGFWFGSIISLSLMKFCPPKIQAYYGKAEFVKNRI